MLTIMHPKLKYIFDLIFVRLLHGPQILSNVERSAKNQLYMPLKGGKRNEKALIVLYCDLMEEITRRHKIIDDVVTSTIQLPERIAEELCFLQLRMICELIALASLAAHGDIAATRAGKIRDAIKADWIMNAMGKIHPNFYPRPSEQVLDTTGVVVGVKFVSAGFLTKQELRKLYHECGEILHRGSITHILSGG
jgi:hypothetical protein